MWMKNRLHKFYRSRETKKANHNLYLYLFIYLLGGFDQHSTKSIQHCK